MSGANGVLPPRAVDARKSFGSIVEDAAKRTFVELGHRLVAVAVSQSLGDALAIEPGGRFGYRTDVGLVIVEVVTTT